MGNQNKFPAPFDGKPLLAQVTETALETVYLKMISEEKGGILAST